MTCKHEWRVRRGIWKCRKCGVQCYAEHPTEAEIERSQRVLAAILGEDATQ
jgi:ribosomal protein L37AE/L43A